MRILRIEDDKQLCDAVSIQLHAEGYETDICLTGVDASYYIENGTYDLILLDRMLPGKDGISILSDLRKSGNTTPVILVTALSELTDKIEGLDAGADDYLPKPYSVDELKARIRALMRRPHKMESANVLHAEDISLDCNELKLYCSGQSCSLSKKECNLLEYLIRNYGQTLSREQIMGNVWGASHFVESSNVDTYIHFVRRRLKAVNSSLQVKSVHGVGYKLIGENT